VTVFERNMTLTRKILTAALLCLILPFWLAAASFSILDRPTKAVKELALHAGEHSSYLDLGELAGALGDSLYWERPGERLVWALEGAFLVFEDRLTFFSLNDEVYQLVAPCLLAGGKFLVPVQVAVEYLPMFWPSRFKYNKLDSRLVDQTGIPRLSLESPVEREKPQPKPSTKAKTSDGKNYRIHTVVIDPGHGGRDPGALGRKYKLKEKQVVLEISQNVAVKLRKSSQLKVILTREEDVLVPLKNRGVIGNQNGAGLFVSIHCNAHEKRNTRGTSTYFLDAAKTDEERATAMLENASLKYDAEEVGPERLDEINLILQDMAQNEYLRESKDLCAFIQKELVRLKELPDKGIRQAGFAVLKGAFMPAALVETAYITNPNDENLLRSKKFRQQVAEAIAQGILKYIDNYHKKLATGM